MGDTSPFTVVSSTYKLLGDRSANPVFASANNLLPSIFTTFTFPGSLIHALGTGGNAGARAGPPDTKRSALLLYQGTC